MNYAGTQRDYIREKAAWIAKHPNATPQQIETACQRIARKLGL